MDHSFIKCTIALTSLPLGMLDDAWMEVESEALRPHHPAYEQLSLFKDYFISIWLENVNVFPRSIWNHYRYDSQIDQRP